MLKFITQYKGLRRENYVLFIGRIVTALGSMVWPVLTLILTQKLGMTAADASLYMICVGAVQLPLGLLGGKLADRYNKKHIIVFFDIISIIFYFCCACVPLSMTTIIFLTLGSLFQSIEGPAYDTLVADITLTENREKAYSLSYLGMNIGLMASPTIAGLLFKDYLWLSFLISGISVGCSTLLIALFVKDISPVEETSEVSSYQTAVDENVSLWQILKQNRVIFIYIVAQALFWSAYGQWSFLLPIDIAATHGADTGAFIYGTLNSTNCVIVVLFTPLITHLFSWLFQTKKSLVGIVLVATGYVVFRLGLGFIPAYYLGIALFTIGEIFSTIANGPYISERMPASHRGRINGILNIIQQCLGGIAMFAIGQAHTRLGSLSAWILVFGMLGISSVLGFILIFRDRVFYPKLYTEKQKN